MLRLLGIGALGNMLSPAALHLTMSNSPARFIRIYDRNPSNEKKQQRRESWLKHGSKIVENYPELISSADFDGIVICAGKNGDDLQIFATIIPLILQHFPSGTRPFLLHCSTVSTIFANIAQKACQQHNIDYANYPLTGGKKGAESASMLILASGNVHLFQKLEPTLKYLGKPKFFGNKTTTAATVKFIGHLMVFNGLLGISSAVTLQTKSIDLSSKEQLEFFDFLNQGAGGTKQWEATLRSVIAQNIWQAGFLLPHAAVDAIYTASLLIQYKMPIISLYPVLNIAAAFSLLLTYDSYNNLATQGLLKLLMEHQTELDKWLLLHSTPDAHIFLQNIIQSLPKKLQEKVKLDITLDDFKIK